MLLPLLLAVTVAHGFTVLTLRRSILAEKVARREYQTDPLEDLFVREVMPAMWWRCRRSTQAIAGPIKRPAAATPDHGFWASM